MVFPLAGLGAVTGAAANAYENIGQKEVYQQLAKLQMQERQRQILLQQQKQQQAREYADAFMQTIGGMGGQPNLFGQQPPGGQGAPSYAPGQIQAQQLLQPIAPDQGRQPSFREVPSYGPSGGMPTNPQLDFARRAIAQGYPPAAAAGMAGSLTGESGQNLDPYALNPTSGAMGRAQWTGPRAQALKASYGARPTGDQQDQFLFNELRGPEAKTGQQMMGETDPRQAARDFTTGFERPGNVPTQSREAAADQIYSQLSPTEQRQSSSIAVDAATAIPPQMAGRLSLQQVAQLVQRSSPNASNEVKAAVVGDLYKLMNQDAKAEFDQKWEMYKFGRQEADKAASRGERREEFGIRRQEVVAGREQTRELAEARLAQSAGAGAAPFQPTDEQGNKVGPQMMLNPRTGQLTPILGMPAGASGGAKVGTQPAGGGVTPTQAQWVANYVKATGTWPVGSGRNQALMNQVEKILGAEGVDPTVVAQAAGTFGATKSSLTAATKLRDAAIGYENTALKNLDVATKALHGVAPTNLGPLLNKWIETGETQAGNAAVPASTAAVLTFANEYAKVMSGATGAQASTVDARREAASLFSPYFSAGQWDEVAKIAKTDMANRKAALDENVDAITQRLGQGTTAKPATGGGKYSVGQVIDTPKGKMRVTGGDMNDPDVEPVQ